MKKTKICEQLTVCDSRSHVQNVVDLLGGFWLSTLFFTLSVVGGIVSNSHGADPIIAWTPVGIVTPVWLLSAIAGAARLVEYHRVIRYLRLHGVRSVNYNFRADALYGMLSATFGRRRVLAAGFTTLVRPMMYEQTLNTFITKRLPRHVWFSCDWWAATLSPAKIIL